MAEYIIYQTTNKVNKKIYVGFSKINHKREAERGPYMGSGKALKLAIEKYGKESFSREILETHDNREEALAAERSIVDEHFIARRDTYNMRKGGFGRMCDYKHSDETKARISKSLIGRKHSAETKAKMSENHRGINNSMFGKKHSAKTLKRISESQKGENNGFFGKKHSKKARSKMSKSHRLGKRCSVDGKVYNSILSASKALGETPWFIKKRAILL